MQSISDAKDEHSMDFSEKDNFLFSRLTQKGGKTSILRKGSQEKGVDDTLIQKRKSLKFSPITQ